MANEKINDKLVTTIIGKLGGKEGDGECWTLVENAILAHGGTSSKTLTPDSGDSKKFADADYVWGDTVTYPAGLEKGDILQFRNYVMKIVTNEDVTFLDGSGYYADRSKEKGRPHHTAVIETISGTRVTILEQNIPKGGSVARDTLELKDVPEASVETQEMRKAKDDKGKEIGDPKPCKVITKTTITVTGSVWGYRARGPEIKSP